MLARGYMDIPHINPDVIRDNFLALADEDTSNMYGDPDILAPWSANRMIWMCHNCGCFGYKQGYINELFKCYNSHCRSRNVTICRAGEMSLLIRNSGAAVGVNMADVYQRRQERLREARRARRSNARRATVSA